MRYGLALLTAGLTSLVSASAMAEVRFHGYVQASVGAPTTSTVYVQPASAPTVYVQPASAPTVYVQPAPAPLLASYERTRGSWRAPARRPVYVPAPVTTPAVNDVATFRAQTLREAQTLENDLRWRAANGWVRPRATEYFAATMNQLRDHLNALGNGAAVTASQRELARNLMFMLTRVRIEHASEGVPNGGPGALPASATAYRAGATTYGAQALRRADAFEAQLRMHVATGRVQPVALERHAEIRRTLESHLHVAASDNVITASDQTLANSYLGMMASLPSRFATSGAI